jgi:hypothetical protein
MGFLLPRISVYDGGGAEQEPSGVTGLPCARSRRSVAERNDGQAASARRAFRSADQPGINVGILLSQRCQSAHRLMGKDRGGRLRRIGLRRARQGEEYQ